MFWDVTQYSLVDRHRDFRVDTFHPPARYLEYGGGIVLLKRQ